MFEMSHPSYLREHARRLRAEKRLTIDELAERLALSRSTVYYWVRDMPIPGSGPGGGFASEAQRKGTLSMQRKYRMLREAAHREGIESFAVLAADPTFRDFVCLYIAEGHKRSRNTLEIANSDTAVVSLAVTWLRRLSTKRFEYSIQYHRDQDLDELRSHWGAALGIDGACIRMQRKSNSNQLTGRIWRSRFGVLSVRVNDTMLRARMQGWTDRIRETWM